MFLCSFTYLPYICCMKTVNKICKECDNSFDALLKEHNRGNANFCSISCAMKNSNRQRKQINKICKHCGRDFQSTNINAKYCSQSCKQKNYRLTSKHILGKEKQLIDNIRKEPCSICNWTESSRDVHHIVPVSKGGKNVESNLISLCPNHHRMVHNNLISENDLYKAIEFRTISSP